MPEKLRNIIACDRVRGSFPGRARGVLSLPSLVLYFNNNS